MALLAQRSRSRPLIVFRNRFPLLIAASLLAVPLTSGCTESPPPPPPPPEVTVARPVVREVVLYRDFTGNTAATERVDVMARVQGFLKSKHFEDGADVEQGDLLFVIEPDEFEAKLAQRKAEVEAAEADVKFAESELRRAEELMRRGAITQAELEIKTADRDKAKAALNLARAAEQEAALDLSYTRVVAPISGRVGRSLPDVGSLVGPMENALLTTIVKFDPIYAYFHLSEIELLEILREYRNNGTAGERGEIDREDYPIAQLGTADRSDYPVEGKIDFADNEVDPKTGTIEVRGIFPNPTRFLVPGMFVRIRVPFRARQQAVLVEETAIGTDLGGKYLLVVGPDNVVEQRYVTLGPRVDALRVVDEGLAPDERYIVQGLLRARPGLPVTPVDQTANTDQAQSTEQAQGQNAGQVPDTPQAEPSGQPGGTTPAEGTAESEPAGSVEANGEPGDSGNTAP